MNHDQVHVELRHSSYITVGNELDQIKDTCPFPIPIHSRALSSFLRALLQLTGVLDDCFCDVESIDVFNNFKIFPRIKQLTERDYFRYYRVRAAPAP